MARISYVNGRYLPHERARIHVEDRGFQFSDGAYEVCAFIDGVIIDLAAHLARLRRSLQELAIPEPMTGRALGVVLAETIRRNSYGDGTLYIQVTRGVAQRNHAFPVGVTPSVIVVARSMTLDQIRRRSDTGVTVTTCPDLRWHRCDIKSISLLPNVLAKEAAAQAGSFEAWQVDGAGMVTEGASSNAWIIDRQGQLITRQLEDDILAGITRAVVIDQARQLQIPVEERAFSPQEAMDGAEAFLTSTTNFVMPVTQIDGHAINDGTPGPITRRLIAAYWDHVETQVAAQRDAGKDGGGTGPAT